MHHNSKRTLIEGIPWCLRNPLLLEPARRTFLQIKERSPKDFRRLQKNVREILPHDDADESTLGEWFSDYPTSDDPTTWNYGVTVTPGVMKLVETISAEDLPAILAHELGHAATVFEDLMRRGQVSREEWRSELAADWYAYKWGFGRQIAKDRKYKDWGHHCVGPGKTFKEDADGKTYHYKITRNFVAHLTEVTEGSLPTE